MISMPFLPSLNMPDIAGLKQLRLLILCHVNGAKLVNIIVSALHYFPYLVCDLLLLDQQRWERVELKELTSIRPQGKPSHVI